jgi:hypothetical protein
VADRHFDRQEVRMNLSGTLSDWTVGDLLNVMKVTQKTASLHIKGNRRGTIHFHEGRVVGAALEGETLISEGEEARVAAADTLYILSTIDQGTFEMGAFEGVKSGGWDVESLLTDLGGLRSLEDDLAGAGLVDCSLMLRDEIEAPVTVTVDDWWALASLVSALSFEQLEEVFGRGRALRLLHSLWRMGLIEAISEPEPVDLELPAEPEEEVLVETDIDAVAGEDEDAWLDEIASSAEGTVEAPVVHDAAEARRVMGVAAPASTVLTGSVLDEMRRLRGRPSE